MGPLIPAFFKAEAGGLCGYEVDPVYIVNKKGLVYKVRVLKE